MVVPITSSSKRVREVMKKDCLKVVWESADYARLDAGCHVYYGTAERDADNQPFYLLNPYEPTHKYEQIYTYEPEFHALQDMWQKYPCCVYTYADNGEVKGRELEWDFLGTPEDALSMVEQSVLNETGHELAPSWIGSVKEKGSSAVSLQGKSSDIFGIIGKIAEVLDTEWWYDAEDNRICIGECRLDAGRWPVIPLAVGKDCETPQVSQNKEDYFTRFYVFGSDRNITQQMVSEITNSAVKKRLPLDSAKYPQGFMDLDILDHPQLIRTDEGDYLPDGVVYQPRQTDKSRVFPKGLYFDEVYPSTRFYVRKIYKNGKDEQQHLVDENGKVIGDTYYVAVSLEKDEGSPVWNDFSTASVLPGETLEMYWTSGILNGRKFTLSAHPKYDGTDTYFYLTPDRSGALTTPNQYLVPQIGDEVTFFGYDFGQTGIDNAKRVLERTATKYLREMVQSNMTFTVKVNAVEFERRSRRDVRFSLMPIGQQIIIDYGNGDVSETLKVIKVESALDIPSEMQFTASAKAEAKGSLSTLTDVVEVNRRTAESKLEEYRQMVVNYANRSFSQVYETMTQINNYFGDEIHATQQMQIVAGSESLQFVFLKTPDAVEYETPQCFYDQKNKRFTLALYPEDDRVFYVKHMTLGIDSISDYKRTNEQRKVWSLTNLYSDYQNDDLGQVYLECPKDTTRENIRPCNLYITDRKMPVEDGDYYYLLLGFLNKADADGNRSFAQMYGYTEILPGRITTDKIVSQDGKTYFDIANGEIGGNINFKDAVMAETIFIRDEDKVDADNKPFYIGGISGAPDLPVLFCGLDPSVTDTNEVERIAREDALPIKLMKKGYGSNIGCLNVVDEARVDVVSDSGLLRLSSNPIEVENSLLAPLTINDKTISAVDLSRASVSLDKTQAEPMVRKIASSWGKTTLYSGTADNNVRVSVMLQPDVSCRLGGVLECVQNVLWTGIVRYEMSLTLQWSNDGTNWNNGASSSLLSCNLSLNVNGTRGIIKEAVMEKTASLKPFNVNGKAVQVRARSEEKFTFESRGVVYSKAKLTTTAKVGKIMLKSSNEVKANIIAGGGITSAIDGDNYFKLYPNGSGRLTMGVRAVPELQSLNLTEGEGSVRLRKWGFLVYCTLDLHEENYQTRALDIPIGYRPVRECIIPVNFQTGEDGKGRVVGCLGYTADGKLNWYNTAKEDKYYCYGTAMWITVD